MEGTGLFPARAECLEVGCGNARLAVLVVDGFRPQRYVATDVDARQLSAAGHVVRQRYPEGRPAALELRPADMLGLDFPDTSFDVVLAFVTIHHASPRHEDFLPVPRALSEIDRVLRPGGLLFYSEIFHHERIREWLAHRGYALASVQRRLRVESVAARKPGGPSPGPA